MNCNCRIYKYKLKQAFTATQLEWGRCMFRSCRHHENHFLLVFLFYSPTFNWAIRCLLFISLHFISHNCTCYFANSYLTFTMKCAHKIDCECDHKIELMSGKNTVTIVTCFISPNTRLENRPLHTVSSESGCYDDAERRSRRHTFPSPIRVDIK